MIRLIAQTPDSWVEAVLTSFNTFLNDHAAAEKKASGMAMSMALHFRDRERLVTEMIDLSIEEMTHFRECVRLLHERGLKLLPDEKDEYVNELRSQVRTTREEGFLDRLLVGGIIEARGVERFGMLAKALPKGDLKSFYEAITRSEERHNGLFLELAREYFADEEIQERLQELLEFEAELVERLPIRPYLH
ncbi:MAG: tRNA-(ms[2]io[6]A)-hydroxylase [Porticoccaceae bacterium]|jgi:tRNA 2-(methylsulfanyl)-N6-isopentenyladenosine37 hydroxylase|nr:tRNA-(ms[2]io[6]A)-hydroxylase [Porticoccaceae bacterium]